jgi:1-phosphofructokinase family hexose kinase
VIITVTPNAAVDVTYRVPRLVPHASHRVTEVAAVAGGKGVNVASVLAGRGVPVLATGLLGGRAGEAVRADLDARGIRHDFAGCAGETRRSVAVVSDSDGDATVFNEPGPPVSRAEWAALLTHLGSLLEQTSASVVVVSGSLPPGAPVDGCAHLVALAHERGARAVVDTSGEPLAAVLAAGPDLVKPNRVEALEATGTDEPVLAARALRARGAREVLVSLGAEGLVLVDAHGTARGARLRRSLHGNPTGAGDAAVAALAATMADGGAPADGLANAVAWSAAAVLHPLAGRLSPTDVDRLLPDVVLDPVTPR